MPKTYYLAEDTGNVVTLTSDTVPAWFKAFCGDCGDWRETREAAVAVVRERLAADADLFESRAALKRARLEAFDSVVARTDEPK